MSQSPVRFGLVGFGLFGTHHANAIATTEGAELVAIAVRSEASQKRARETHPDIAVTGDYRELLERDDIDAINVVVPNQLHFEIGSAALRAGKHLLLEKPMALKVGDCDELIQLAEANDRVLAVGHELRVSSLWGKVRELIDDGVIGAVQHVLIELSRFPYRQGSEGWRYDVHRVGDWILEEPIHFFDLARWYLRDAGEPESIYARANSRHPQHPELRDNFSAIVNFPNQAYAVVSQTLAAFGHHQSAKVVGTEGTIWAQWGAADARSDRPTYSLRYGLGDEITEVNLTKPAGELLELSDQIARFAECIRDAQPPPCTGRDGRWATLLCLAAQHSADTDRVVAIDEFARI